MKGADWMVISNRTFLSRVVTMWLKSFDEKKMECKVIQDVYPINEIESMMVGHLV